MYTQNPLNISESKSLKKNNELFRQEKDKYLGILQERGIEEVMLKLHGEFGTRVLLTIVITEREKQRASENVEDVAKVVTALCRFANAQLLIFDETNCQESSFTIESVYLSGQVPYRIQDGGSHSPKGSLKSFLVESNIN
ncbi:hypothetical protein FGO68_gene16105 [Halteria grandinella]|uniref:Uncharacterized protein n=1 Tax=Halteria grandinella TaxID=5974 RepID=A0A8J8NFR2_HALGN|nr:hypothetical protein FGO68_gene16105 [Halteria grandinella]